MYVAMDLMSRLVSPYDVNPMGKNPLREILAELIDFKVLAQSPIHLFITATNVRTGRGKVFKNDEVTPDVLLASACLPTMFQAIEIDGEAYWDGGYSGNPTLTPLIRECKSQDTILVPINPIERPGIPRSACDILNRLNEVSFNAVVLKELRMMALLRKVADPGDGEGKLWARDARACTSGTPSWRSSAHRRSSMRNGRSSRSCATRGGRPRKRFSTRTRWIWENARLSISTFCWREFEGMGLLGILIALGLLIWLAYRGWSILLLAPGAAILAAALAGEPLLAHWTQTFMGSAAQFVMQFFPIFLLGALFGKLMEDSGSVTSIAKYMTGRLGPQRSVLAVVLAGAIVTYGGVSLFVAFFVLAPMAHQLFRAAAIPRRLMPAAIALGTTTFTMSALPGTPAIQNAIPMPFFGTTPFAAPGLGIIAALVMFGFGMWWLGRAEKNARAKGEGYGEEVPQTDAAEDLLVRERATTASTFDPPEAIHGAPSDDGPPIALAALPLVVVVAVNLLMSLFVLPRTDASFLAQKEWGSTSLSAVGGVWAVVTALFVAIVVLVAVNYRRLPALRDSMDAGANASVLPVLSVASLVGFGSVVAALPAFGLVRDWVLGIEGGPLVSLAVATNVLASLTGSASGGLTIALDALGATYLKIAHEQGIDPGLLHRVAVIGAGTLDSLPHNGAVVTLLAVCNSTHRESYLDIVMVSIVGGLLALAVVIILGSTVGYF